MHSSDFSSVIVLRRASAITVQELKSLISFAIVVRESLCPANKPKTQNFNLVEQTGTDPCNEDEHRTRWWLFLCKCKIGNQGIIERWTESYGNQEKRERERESFWKNFLLWLRENENWLLYLYTGPIYILTGKPTKRQLIS